MFNYDLDELYADVKPILGEAEPTWGNLYAHFDYQPMSTLTLADDFKQTVHILEVHQMCMAMAIGIAKIVNTSVDSGDEAAIKVAARMNEERSKYHRWSVSADPEFRYLPAVMAEHGYAPSGDLLVALAFLDKWGPQLRAAIPRVTVVKPELQSHFVTALLTMGVGEIISPFKLLLYMPVEPREVERALEIFMDFIENEPHAWHVTNVATDDLMMRFVTSLDNNPGKTLYTGFLSSSDDDIIESVVTADISDPIQVPSASKFRQVITTKPGQTKFEAVKENLEALIRDANVPNYKVSEIRIMDDDGQVIGIEEFYRQNGEEVPPVIKEELDRHG